MKLTVRLTKDAQGRYSAHCIQKLSDGREIQGQNLLAGHIYRRLDSAIERCDIIILSEYKLLDPPEIAYEVPPESK